MASLGDVGAANVKRADADRGRFGFGENWSRFASALEPSQIETARRSVTDLLGRDTLEGMSFLDVGSGSGLFSLAACNLGAKRVHSLDYDPISVATTESLRERYAPGREWSVERGSALDPAYMRSLGQFDVVYSWGVLHHTGRMWEAIGQTCELVAPGGLLAISIYNDQGALSSVWKLVKRVYNALPTPLRPAFAALAIAPMELKMLAARTLRGRPGEYFELWRSERGHERGMDRWRDIVDWVGGFPFEVASREQVIEFCTGRGFTLERIESVGRSHGCNQFVFERTGHGG